MALDFPSAPTIGQKHPPTVTGGAPQYQWDGDKWINSTSYTPNTYVLRVGDTMTGNLAIAKSIPILILDRTDDGTNSIALSKGGLNRWCIQAGINPETGANAGSDFYLYRFGDDGINIGSPSLIINRATGAAALGGSLTLPSDPTLALHAATKQYADTKINVVRFRFYTASGTYVPHANMRYAFIELCGGGGSGGGALGVAGFNSAGGGGGAGGYACKMVSAADIGASKPVTVGAGGAGVASNQNGNAGGTTSVGSLCSAYGGGGGAYSSGYASIPASGVAGAGTVGDLTLFGANGIPGSINQDNLGIWPGGAGGASRFSGGGAGGLSGYGSYANGVNGNHGAGGGGAAAQNAANGPSSGAGGTGLVIITEYCTA